MNRVLAFVLMAELVCLIGIARAADEAPHPFYRNIHTSETIADHAASDPDPRDNHWDNGISSPLPPGTNGDVQATVVFDGKLIAAGSFTRAGETTRSYIAAWDGVSWSTLGTGVDGTVGALAVYDGMLIAGGSFTTAGGATVNHLAAWNGTSWSALGSGTSADVSDLVVYDGKLIACGAFATAGGTVANRIAAWNGEFWSSVGPATGVDGSVKSLTVYDDRLIAGGIFTAVGGTSANSVAAWDGTSWSALGSGIEYGVGAEGAVSSLMVYDDELIVGGQFFLAGGTIAYYLAAWDGASWSPLGLGWTPGREDTHVFALTEYDGRLIVGGRIYSAGGMTASHIAAWDGATWSALPGLSSHVMSLTVFEGRLIAGGNFMTAGAAAVNHIAAWNGSSWMALGTAISGPTRALTIYDGKLIAAGSFANDSGDGSNRVAVWDGSSWSALGPDMNGTIRALAIYEDRLIAGGDFTTAGGTTVHHVAEWDGTSWSALGTGLESRVRALEVYEGKLIAGGDFREAGGPFVNGIFAWDGSSWAALGTGTSGRVYALCVYDNQLVAGGDFLRAGSAEARLLAAWNGASWSVLGAGLDYNHQDNEFAPTYIVEALNVFDGRLLAGGRFRIMDGEVSSLAAWDGATWSDEAAGIFVTIRQTPRVYALTVYDGKLIMGGFFRELDSLTTNFVAALDGTSWSSLGTGVDGPIRAMIPYDDALVVGGEFRVAGNEAAPYLATWTQRGVQEVILDVRPSSCPNPIAGSDAHGQGKAILPAGILGTEDVDVRDIDPTLLTLNGAAPVHWSYRDVAGPAEESEDDCSCSSAGPDGHDDLVLRFYRADVVASLNPNDETSSSTAHPRQRSYVVTAEGQLIDGTPFAGQDCVTLVGGGEARNAMKTEAPRSFEVLGNYPNPFNPSTQISFHLPSSMHVRLEIFNALGRRVTTLVDEELSEGEHAVVWSPVKAGSGVYYYRLEAGENIVTRKMLLLE